MRLVTTTGPKSEDVPNSRAQRYGASIGRDFAAVGTRPRLILWLLAAASRSAAGIAAFSPKSAPDPVTCPAPTTVATDDVPPGQRLCRLRLGHRGSLLRWPRRLRGASGPSAPPRLPDRRW